MYDNIVCLGPLRKSCNVTMIQFLYRDYHHHHHRRRQRYSPCRKRTRNLFIYSFVIIMAEYSIREEKIESFIYV